MENLNLVGCAKQFEFEISIWQNLNLGFQARLSDGACALNWDLSEKSAVSVLLGSQTEQENMILQRKLAGLKRCFPSLYFINGSIYSPGVSFTQSTRLVIMNSFSWGVKEADSLSRLYSLGYKGRTLILTKADRRPDLKSNFLLSSIDRLAWIKRNSDRTALFGISKKLIQGRPIGYQIHDRHFTLIDAVAEFDGTAVPCRVVNLSKSGACIDQIASRKIRVGENCKLKFHFVSPVRSYDLQTKIVWSKEEPGSRTQSVGLQFE